ncbi:MAG: glycine--tRNA ligase subunit beta, partial [Deltaproteobacteria bacterium]|nr:glycine--tRNA ligase subunit beta [Deltaproteobacteria bacterium]
MKKDLLFEIGTEELPAGIIPRALQGLEGLLTEKLSQQRMSFVCMKTLGAPRRLTLIVWGLEDKQSDLCLELKGPNIKSAYDEKGLPTKALLGFMNAQGLGPKDIKTVTTDKGEYVYGQRFQKGEKTKKILPEILKEILCTFLFPKSMRWADKDVSFARPVHWILALYGKDIVRLEFAGIKSADITYGHRFFKGNTLFKVKAVNDYGLGLKKRNVIVDPAERKRLIAEGIEKEAGRLKAKVLPDEGLLEEVANLVEWPVVIVGSFDREFLELPRDVVINAMREHQRYFSLVDNKAVLLPRFVAIANTAVKKTDVVRKGNERVLRARLNDARFYFKQDMKTPLKDMALGLKGVIYQARLGTLFEKAERFAGLSIYIFEAVGSCPADPDRCKASLADFIEDRFNPKNLPEGSQEQKRTALIRAALFAKADLVSGMVKEFPKLQGIMGSIYAEKSGEIPAVSNAISEHYMPTSAGGELPRSMEGAVISIADKLDTIVGCFGIGLIPTGGQDPYALRRQALGIIAIIQGKGILLALDLLVQEAVTFLSSRFSRKPEEIKRDVLDFFKERFRNQLLAQGFSFDAIDAVLSTSWYNILDAVKRVAALEAFKKETDCPQLVIAFKRVSNILKG